MITADQLTLLTNMPAVMLSMGIQKAGYKKDKFETAQFLGMTNAAEFCYKVAYLEDNEFHETKVFVRYDPTADQISVGY